MADFKDIKDLQEALIRVQASKFSLDRELVELNEQLRKCNLTLEQESEAEIDLISKMEHEGNVLRLSVEELRDHPSVISNLKQRKSYMSSALDAMKAQIKVKEKEFMDAQESDKKKTEATKTDFAKKKETFFSRMMNEWNEKQKTMFQRARQEVDNSEGPLPSASEMTEQYESLLEEFESK